MNLIFFKQENNLFLTDQSKKLNLFEKKLNFDYELILLLIYSVHFLNNYLK